jgi:hypothetical protein
MDAKLVPFMYAALVFSVIAFLFILLGRIFLNVETIYFYEFEVCDTSYNKEFFQIEEKISERARNGWKYEGYKDMITKGTDSKYILLIFMKTKNKIKFF